MNSATTDTNTAAESLQTWVAEIVEQFEVVMGRPDRVVTWCQQLADAVSSPDHAELECLDPLLDILSRQSGPLTVPLYELFETISLRLDQPRHVVERLLACRDDALYARAVQLAATFSSDDRMIVDCPFLKILADAACFHADQNGADVWRSMASLVAAGGMSTQQLIVDDTDWNIRRMAAQLLDRTGEPAPAETCRRLIGDAAYKVLAPYFDYLRTTHVELLSLVAAGVLKQWIQEFLEAEQILGRELMRDVIAEAGWSGLNLGITASRRVRVSVGPVMPLFLSPSEAAFFERAGARVETDDTILIVTHGSDFPTPAGPEEHDDPATRFRLLNLAHAEILADFLTIAPLTPGRIHGMIDRMDRIVSHYVNLFSSFSDECRILPAMYSELRSKILDQLPTDGPDAPMPPDLTRLVMMFEDPHNAGEVRTLHGLKRYLHQKGLQLGFKLVLRSRSTNRRVSILLAARNRLIVTYHGIRYMDFEPGGDDDHAGSGIPYPIQVVIDGFGRQMLFGQEAFPRVDIFCYGNEIHYYLAFRNHPAFVRINYAPPLQGGMIDLEYFGVSKYELSVHPNPTLEALQQFFINLEFDIQIENTRVKARFDKEQAHDLGTLCRKASIFFCLAPYLLDIDWTIGALSLPEPAGKKIAEAWAGLFAAWRALPLKDLLTPDRQGIVESVEQTVTGRKETVWTGEGIYRDRFSGVPDPNVMSRLEHQLDQLGLDTLAIGDVRTSPDLEEMVIRPLREGVSRGQWHETAEGFEPAAPGCYEPCHEAEYFADILASGDDRVAAAVRLAALVGPLEKFLNFQTTGHVQGYDVQSAVLELTGSRLGIFVLRGEKHRIQLAFFSHVTLLFRRREHGQSPWWDPVSLDAESFAGHLRRANYAVSDIDAVSSLRKAEDVVRTYRGTPAAGHREILPGERILGGLRASPGRAVGEALLDTSGRSPEDFFERLLVAPSIRPDDAPFMFKAAGIVSTGGGILSHAGLMASQFKKPALIVEGHWERLPNGRPALKYRGVEYRLEWSVRHGFRVGVRRNLTHPMYVLRDGDLVVLDSEEGTLQVLGQERDTISLHESLRMFWKAARRLASTMSDADFLAWRGRQLRARHLIEKTLTRLRDPVIACFAIRQLLLHHDEAMTTSDRAALIQLVLSNSDVKDTARRHLAWIAGELRESFQRQWHKATALIPNAESVFEVLALRRDAWAVRRRLDDCTACLATCGLPVWLPEETDAVEFDRLTLHRLSEIESALFARVLATDAGDAVHRHLIRQMDRIHAVLPSHPDVAERLATKKDDMAAIDNRRRDELRTRLIIGPDDGGLELGPLIGWKAANLAEAARLLGAAHVPPWFAITDRAFEDVLASRLETILPDQAESLKPATCLRDAIDRILQSNGSDLLQKAATIRAMWEAVVLPHDLVAAITNAYAGLATGEDAANYVALRSSSHEEDIELAARAGEFDTFLYLQGIDSVLRHLKLTWSGLWGERALHNRAAMGVRSAVGGGVIVQRMINARVSGVLQTINVGQNDLREMVINAGIGLGEGIVSGIVAADHVIVSKDVAGGSLRFSYLTADKKDQIVFNRRTGAGTMRSDLAYHQRLRPALEYIELQELVATALKLEPWYGYPLDMEFAIEGARLWILQVRPVPVFMSVIQETTDYYPWTTDRVSAHPIATGVEPS